MYVNKAQIVTKINNFNSKAFHEKNGLNFIIKVSNVDPFFKLLFIGLLLSLFILIIEIIIGKKLLMPQYIKSDPLLSVITSNI